MALLDASQVIVRERRGPKSRFLVQGISAFSFVPIKDSSPAYKSSGGLIMSTVPGKKYALSSSPMLPARLSHIWIGVALALCILAVELHHNDIIKIK